MEGGAFKILDCFDLFGEFLALRMLNGGLLPFSKAFEYLPVINQVVFQSNQQKGDIGTMKSDLRNPFGSHAFKGLGINEGEAHQEDFRPRVRERAEPVINV